jgi:RNA polymerase subunit RPABC4/transcription elongation factor Spt4
MGSGISHRQHGTNLCGKGKELVMAEIERCPECQVPTQTVTNHVWLAGGIIVQSNDREHRMVLIECENLDPLYKGIEEIIGVPIQRIIIETKRRATCEYIGRIIPPEVKEMIQKHEIGVEPMIGALNVTSAVMGYGNTTLVGYRFEGDDDDFVIERIKEPYSVPLWCGDLTGSTEAVTGMDNDVTYEMESSDIMVATTRPAEHPAQFQGRLEIKKYGFEESGIEMERCPSCGGPTALSAFEWHDERGVILSTETGRRVAMLGPAYQDAIFSELERELGDTIPRVIVEAQRRFVKTGFYSIEEIQDTEGFRMQFALRGLGELQEMEISERGLKVGIRNAALHLMVIGLMQGYFETATGSESHVDWEMRDDGFLELNITRKE